MRVAFSHGLVARLGKAGSIAAFTGAGISAESGVPTFRGTDGIWSKFKPEELASMSAFMKNPELVWEWYNARRKIIASVRPNPGHFALVAMEKLFDDVTVITQNIDNLHRRAGSTTVYELHGNIERNYCMKCGSSSAQDEILQAGGVPHCRRPGCGGLIRPDVVWFGEMLPEDQWRGAVKAVATADVFFSVGTSGVVYPAASLPSMAKQQGAYLVEINPEPTPITDSADEFLQGPAGEILPALLEKLKDVRSATGASPL